jgi:tetratricopeptide (TPR) repeat protein
LYLRTSAEGRFIDQTRLALGEFYYNNNQDFAALDHFRRVSDSDTSLYIKALAYVASIDFRRGNYAKAGESYQKIRALTTGTSKSVEAFAQLITSEIREGRLSQAETHIKEFRKAHKNVDDYLAKFTIELGEYWRLNKKYSKATNYFSTVKRKYSKTNYADDADYLLALTNITLNKTEDALKVLSNFPSKYPKSDRLPAVYNTLGTIYFRSEKYDAAIATFKKALDLNDDSGMEQQIMSNLIKAYTMTGFWDAAQGLSRSYVENYPFAEDVIDKKILIAQAFINLNQFQNGVEYLKKIKIEADSEREPEIQFYIGEALLKAGQYENAIAEFVKIPLLSKKTKLQWEASALYYAGQAYEKLGRIKDAIRMYQEIVSRPGIDLILKKDASKRIKQIEG